MTHPYIYQHRLERHAEDIHRAEQHRLARTIEPPPANRLEPADGPGPVHWNVWSRLFAGWPFRPTLVGPDR
jgi:hypothetical protein